MCDVNLPQHLLSHSHWASKTHVISSEVTSYFVSWGARYRYEVHGFPTIETPG